MTHDEEADQIARAAKGDRMAMHRLVTDYSPAVYRLAFRMLSRVEDAEDVTQEAFLRAWKVLPKWKPDAKLSTWLHRVALNLCYDRLRKTREPLFSEPPEQADGAHKRPDARLQQTQVKRAVETAIEALPDRQRAALTLTALEGHSNKLAAEMMDISLQAIESLLARARRSLKTELTPLKDSL
ncbi:MAG: sigma-70 family RNA polymerase sigma factor [Hyphomonadaceae bacterium]